MWHLDRFCSESVRGTGTNILSLFAITPVS
nr:MAG TPA: hypothetical protein [Caudoviricetes sp.]